MKCAPKIWKKFNSRQKKTWTKLNKFFSEPLNFPPEWTKDKKKIAVVAHNLAIVAALDCKVEIVE